MIIWISACLGGSWGSWYLQTEPLGPGPATPLIEFFPPFSLGNPARANPSLANSRVLNSRSGVAIGQTCGTQRPPTALTANSPQDVPPMLRHHSPRSREGRNRQWATTKPKDPNIRLGKNWRVQTPATSELHSVSLPERAHGINQQI